MATHTHVFPDLIDKPMCEKTNNVNYLWDEPCGVNYLKGSEAHQFHHP